MTFDCRNCSRAAALWKCFSWSKRISSCSTTGETPCQCGGLPPSAPAVYFLALPIKEWHSAPADHGQGARASGWHVWENGIRVLWVSCLTYFKAFYFWPLCYTKHGSLGAFTQVPGRQIWSWNLQGQVLPSVYLSINGSLWLIELYWRRIHWRENGGFLIAWPTCSIN